MQQFHLIKIEFLSVTTLRVGSQWPVEDPNKRILDHAGKTATTACWSGSWRRFGTQEYSPSSKSEFFRMKLWRENKAILRFSFRQACYQFILQHCQNCSQNHLSCISMQNYAPQKTDCSLAKIASTSFLGLKTTWRLSFFATNKLFRKNFVCGFRSHVKGWNGRKLVPLMNGRIDRRRATIIRQF